MVVVSFLSVNGSRAVTRVQCAPLALGVCSTVAVHSGGNTLQSGVFTKTSQVFFNIHVSSK